MTNQFRQGDVLLEEITTEITTKKSKETLLVRGEGRNHGHFIHGADVYEGDKESEWFLDVKSEAFLKHLLIDTGVSAREHETITIPKGKYRVIRQVEYNPYEKAIRKVQD